MESISYLNGLEETPLPAITAGTANEYIRVNTNESAYELAQPSDILPSQSNNQGKYLTTNGSDTSWAEVRQLPTSATAGLLLRSDGGTGGVWTSTPSILSLSVSQNVTCGGTVQGNFLTAGTLRSTSTSTNQATILVGNNVGTGIGGSAGVVGTTGRYVNIWVNDLLSHTSASERFRVNGVGEALLMNGTVLKGDGASSGSFSFANGTTPTVTSLNISNQGGPTGPSLTFGDLGGTTGNTGPSGIYANPVDNSINFSTNGVERMLIDNTGVKVGTVRADSGSEVNDKGYVFEDSHGSGLQWENSGGILRLCHNNSAVIGMSSTTTNITSTSIGLNGTVTCSNKINAATGASNGIGIANQSTSVDFNPTGYTVNLRSNGTVRVACNSSGTNVTGNLTQTSSVGNVNTSSGTTTHTGLFKIDKSTVSNNALEIVNGDISLETNSDIVGVDGTIKMGVIQANNAGTSALNAVRVVDDNTGLFQGSANRLDLCAAGTAGLNLTTSRIQNQVPFECSRSLAFPTGIYTFSQTYNIQTNTNPFIISKSSGSGNMDFEFSAPTNYFGNQEFRILVLNTSAATIRYRAQAETLHITPNAAAVTIATNTYHTLVKDRFHFVYCNIDGGKFYLIQT